MIRFMYAAEYACSADHSITDRVPKLSQILGRAADIPKCLLKGRDLTVYAHMYALADKYDVHGLKEWYMWAYDKNTECKGTAKNSSWDCGKDHICNGDNCDSWLEKNMECQLCVEAGSQEK